MTFSSHFLMTNTWHGLLANCVDTDEVADSCATDGCFNKYDGPSSHAMCP